MKYEARACFKAGGKRQADARRVEGVNRDKSIISGTEKLMGNFYYGKTDSNKEKFTKVEYLCVVEQSSELDRLVSRVSILCYNLLDDEYHEVEPRAGTIRLHLPAPITFICRFHVAII